MAEAEKTLQALDGIGRVEANPYLFSKIINGMEAGGQEEKRFNFKLAIAVVAICILTNLASYFYTPVNSYSAEYEREFKLKTLATEYSSTNNYYFY
ncbi:MAG: hypothetical protein NTU73_03410 [Ignavibacteriae bacterium]|nr:hypothetical protein [Ignavibacteriota bacterium]